MNILLDGLPSEVDINGRSVRINTDYRAGLKFEKLLNDRRRNELDTLLDSVSLYFPGEQFSDQDAGAVVDAMLWFYRCGDTDPIEDQDGAGGEERAFDIDYDAGLVYSAFLQAYGIDLVTEKLHWWQFRSLFDSLPDSTRLIQIIGYRTAEVPENATDKERQRIEKLRRAHALPEDAGQKQLKTDLEKILRSGGNPSAVIEGGASDGIRRDLKI